MISIIAKFILTEGKESLFLELVNELIVASNAEAGCIEYALQKHTEKQLTYCLIEKWKDKGAVNIHNNTSHFTTTIPKLVEIAVVEVDVYKTV